MQQLSRRTLLLVLAGVVAVAAGIATPLVLLSRGGGESAATRTAPTVRSEALRGLPQRGIRLGDPAAPALVEYADMQCPYCADYSNLVLPTVIREYVRTGKVRLVFHGLAFVGPDSTTALRAVEAAGIQNKLWNVLEGLFARQGAENSGWVTEDLLREVGAGVPGLDVARWLGDMKSDEVAQRMYEAQQAAKEDGVNSTPSFLLNGKRLQLQSLDPAGFRAALEPLLGGQ